MRNTTLELISLSEANQGERANRRRIRRAPALLSLIYSGMDSGEMLIGDGAVTNLSERGVGIRGNRLVKRGMDLSLFVDLPDADEPVCVAHARVLWVNGRRFGVEVIRIDIKEDNQLRYFLLGTAA